MVSVTIDSNKMCPVVSNYLNLWDTPKILSRNFLDETSKIFGSYFSYMSPSSLSYHYTHTVKNVRVCTTDPSQTTLNVLGLRGPYVNKTFHAESRKLPAHFLRHFRVHTFDFILSFAQNTQKRPECVSVGKGRHVYTSPNSPRSRIAIIRVTWTQNLSQSKNHFDSKRVHMEKATLN